MDVIKGSNKKPAASAQLAEIVEQHFNDEDGVLYIGYPILATADGREAIDALWISRPRGLIAIHMVEGRDTQHFGEAQDEIASLLEAEINEII